MVNSKQPLGEQQAVIVQARQQLEHQAANLSASTLAALDAARREATRQAEQQPGWDRRWNRLAYVPALAAVLLVGVFWNGDPRDASPAPVNVVAEPTDIEMALTGEDFEMVQQELEFYLWMEQQPGQS